MNNKHNKKESKLEVTTMILIRWAGLFAILAGVLYIVIQLIHPSDHISSVNTNTWLIVACLTIAMSLFSLIGIIGIYTKQVKETGWLGLIGFLIFSLFWLAAMAFSFIEAFGLPLLTTDASKFVNESAIE
jgi:drug/metabolite transporter (DMT)-like permease